MGFVNFKAVGAVAELRLGAGEFEPFDLGTVIGFSTCEAGADKEGAGALTVDVLATLFLIKVMISVAAMFTFTL